jgi:hypothetical protein
MCNLFCLIVYRNKTLGDYNMSVTCKLAKFKHRDLKEDESLSEDLTFIEGTFLGLTINPSSLCYINNKEIELSNIILKEIEDGYITLVADINDDTLKDNIIKFRPFIEYDDTTKSTLIIRTTKSVYNIRFSLDE